MSAEPTKLGIVGLGRWARVLTQASRGIGQNQDRAGLQPLRGQASRLRARDRRAGVPDLKTMLADPEIKGVILTVPTSSICRWRAKSQGRRSTSIPRSRSQRRSRTDFEIEALESRYGVTVTVGHSARLMAGIREIRQAIDAGELGRVAFMEANFSNERALELTPTTWRWYAPRARRAAVATRDSSVRRSALSRRRNRRGEFDRLETCRRSAPRSTTNR